MSQANTRFRYVCVAWNEEDVGYDRSGSQVRSLEFAVNDPPVNALALVDQSTQGAGQTPGDD
ncbi:MAG: hypothetical protein CO132_04480 [Candidatus Kerfeldbacteria bacterium CG_4_9_14_3_um_filter_45_8]|nr:MAG: hypothetical protein CO132_04480 [Candidatus Kerfeldbacteria bacterium CG_4_9_14_3_um_filter_45_8]